MFDTSSVSDMNSAGTYTQTTLFIFFDEKDAPDMFPEQWEKSIFRMPRPVFNVVMRILLLRLSVQRLGPDYQLRR